MKKLGFVLLVALSLIACAIKHQTEGTVGEGPIANPVGTVPGGARGAGLAKAHIISSDSAVDVPGVSAALYAAPQALRDVTTGSNGAYQAGPGWDACTGLGSPDGIRLLAVLRGPGA